MTKPGDLQHDQPDEAARKRREERERLRAEQPALFAEVHAIITRHDPMGIIFADHPRAAETEYDPEVGTILPRLSGVGTIGELRRIVNEEFDRWFGADTSRDPRRIIRLRGIADEIWDAWNHSRPQ